MKIIRLLFGAALAMALVMVPAPCASAAAKHAGRGEYFVYIGTYTGPQSKGIYSYRFNTGTGKLTPIGLAAETEGPSFLAVHPNRRFLYAVNEINSYNGQKGGAVSAFVIDPKTGKLTFLNKVSSRGAGPCHLVVDKTGRNILVANYGGGSVAVLPVKRDGRLGDATAFVQHSGAGANPKRQSGPHGHCVTLSRNNRFAVVADLGLDEVLVYRFDPRRGALTPNDPPFAKVNPGAGPRHFAFHPTERFAYVINEMQSTVTAFTYDANSGVLKELQTLSTLPSDFSGNNSTAELEAHPSGKYLYGSNRGHDSIAVFAIDAAKGTLTPSAHVSTQGKTPRNFSVDPTGAYLFAANQNSGNVVVFRIDPNTGKPAATGESVQVASPVCVKFVPAR